MIDPIPILEISTVTGCKINCTSYCPQSLHVKNYAQKSGEFVMSLDTFKRCIETIPKNVEIQFAGMAEPWLNPNATEMVLYAHERGHVVSIFTTACGLTVEDVERIKYVPFRLFCIHLPDGDGLMQLKVTDDYLSGLKACLDISDRTLMCVGRLHPAVREILGHDVPDSSPGLYSRAGNLKDRAVPRKTGKLKELPCMHHGVLLPNGDIVLCCQDYAIKHVLVNLLQVSYDSLYDGLEFQRILRGLEDETEDILCRTCELAEAK